MTQKRIAPLGIGKPPSRRARAWYLGSLVTLACGELTAPTAVQIAGAHGDAEHDVESNDRGPTPVRPQERPGSSTRDQAGADEREPDDSSPSNDETPPSDANGDDAAPDDTAATTLAYRPGLGRVVDIVAGFDHTCALLDTGQVRCWGDGAMLGYGDEGNFTSGEHVGDDERPAAAGFVPLGEPARQISAGYAHTCAVLDSGGVRCWGHGFMGELGYGDQPIIGFLESARSAGNVDVGGDVREIVAGSQATCALLRDAQLRCWGMRYNGTSEPRATPFAPECPDLFNGCELPRLQPDPNEEVPTPPIPIPSTLSPIDLGSRVEQIAIAAEHSCALLDGGRVRCWGLGVDGRLGYGNTNDILDPREAGDVDVGGPVKQIAVGPSQTCAVLEQGNVRCWGFGVDGRLGYGNTNDIGDDETPASAGDIDVGGPVRSIGMQGGLVCALLEAGSVRCWGPGVGLHPDGTEPKADDGVGIEGGPEDGLTIACKLRDFRVLDCPGYVGALGYAMTGSVGDDETPATMGDVKLAGAARKLAVGGNHACVVLETGGVQCWGSSAHGALGYGKRDSIGDDETPESAGFVDVAGSPTMAAQPTHAVQIAAGYSHTCAVLDSGAVRCWGEASAGQLGYGNKEDIGDDEEPIVAGDVDVRGIVRQVAAGPQHTCVLLDSGAVRCWGDAASGSLGYEDTQDVGYANVPGSVGYVDLGGAASYLHSGLVETCAVMQSGALHCWGLDTASFAYASTRDRRTVWTPQSIGGSARQVALGFYDTCVLLDGGHVRCWGLGATAVRGYVNGVLTELSTPAEVPEVDLAGAATRIAMGYPIACALIDDGRVQCWTHNTSTLWTAVSLTNDDVLPGTAFTLNLPAPAVDISSDGYMLCVVLENGDVRCWDYFFDEISGSIDPRLTAPASAITHGGIHDCALLETGHVRCWGSAGPVLGQPAMSRLYSVDAYEVESDIHLF